jgi:hypothetical protein
MQGKENEEPMTGNSPIWVKYIKTTVEKPQAG